MGISAIGPTAGHIGVELGGTAWGNPDTPQSQLPETVLLQLLDVMGRLLSTLMDQMPLGSSSPSSGGPAGVSPQDGGSNSGGLSQNPAIGGASQIIEGLLQLLMEQGGGSEPPPGTMSPPSGGAGGFPPPATGAAPPSGGSGATPPPATGAAPPSGGSGATPPPATGSSPSQSAPTRMSSSSSPGADLGASSVQPPNSINVRDYGAVGNGSTDDTAALQAAFNAAATSGKTVWLPPGTYNHGGLLDANGINVVGAGSKSILKATNPDQEALEVTGNGGSVSNLATETSARDRSSQPQAAAIWVSGAQNATIKDVTTVGAASNGVRVDDSNGTMVEGSFVDDTNADGITVDNGSSNTTIQKNQVSNAGDDGISGLSLGSDAKPVEGLNIIDNNIGNNAYGRGIFVSANNVKIEGNVANGGTGSGITVGQDGSSNTRAAEDVTISGNTIINKEDPTFTPIGLYNTGGTAETGISVTGNTVLGTNPGIQDISVRGNFVSPEIRGNNVGGAAPSDLTAAIDAALGWTPATPLARSAVTNYQVGTGSGANN